MFCRVITSGAGVGDGLGAALGEGEGVAGAIVGLALGDADATADGVGLVEAVPLGLPHWGEQVPDKITTAANAVVHPPLSAATRTKCGAKCTCYCVNRG